MPCTERPGVSSLHSAMSPSLASPILGVPGSVTYICLFTGFVLIALVHLGELLHWTDESHEQATGAF